MYGPWILLIIVFISSIPVIAVYVWFRLAKYQFKLIWFLLALLAGAAAFFPALVMQRLLNFPFFTGGRLELFYHVFFRIALTEELSRLLMLLVFFYISNRITKDTSGQPLSWLDVKKGAAIGLVAGLGFAILENAVYAAADTRILLLRAVTAAPLHGACGSRVGTAAVMLRTNPVQAIFRILAATAIHGIYNFMAAAPGLPSIMAILVAFSALFTAISTIHSSWASEEKPLDKNGENQ